MNTRTNLHWKMKPKVLDLLTEICRKDADGYSVYRAGWTDRKAAEKFTEELGVTVTSGHVASMRAAEFGNVRRVPGGARNLRVNDFAELLGRVSALEERVALSTDNPLRLITADEANAIIHTQAALVEMIENFRAVMAGHGQKIEGLRKVVEVGGAEQLESIYRVKERLESLLAQEPIDRDGLFRKMRGEGFQDGATQSALVLMGAIIHGDTVLGPAHDWPAAAGAALPEAEVVEPDREDRAKPNHGPTVHG